MQLERIKLLQIQRALHDLPCGMRGDSEDLLLPPLVTMNPMGREHVAARLDKWLALDSALLSCMATRPHGCWATPL